jgi:hypothetical protein
MNEETSGQLHDPNRHLRLSMQRIVPEVHPEQPAYRTIKAKEVARKIQSVDHFAHIWGEKGGFYLPPKKFLTWEFIAQVLSGAKKLVRVQQVGYPVELPKVKGLYVQELYWHYCDEHSLRDYFPDMGESHRVPRTYFFNVSSKGTAHCSPSSLRLRHRRSQLQRAQKSQARQR